MLSSLRAHLQPKLLLPGLTTGLVFGISNAVIAMAYALLIFSGELTVHLPVGITLLLLGNAIIALVTALSSSFPGVLASVQDSPSVIMSVVIAAMLAGMPSASLETKLYTALAAIMITSLLTGVVCWLLGRFKVGYLVSYIPYPVVGGFLAGAGIMLILGALSVMNGKTITLYNLGQLFQANGWAQWVSGVCFAVVLYLLVQKVNHYLTLPIMLGGTVALFYVVLAVSGNSAADAARQGWLTSGLPEGGVLPRLWNPSSFSQVNWNILLGQAGSLLACVVVSLISLLLNTTALELSTGEEINLDRELKSNGLANLIAGAIGSSAGYVTLSDTALAYRIGARSRLNGIFMAAVIVLTLLAGGKFLGYFPNLVLGGLLFFTGIDFLYTWLYRTWSRMPRADYAIIFFIALLINTWGFLQGVGVGLALAVLLFVVQYSRTRAVRHTLTGVSYQSSVDRTRLSAHLLRRHGDWLYILELQGYIFFGTANQVLDELRAHLDQPACFQPPRFIILDFRLVSGVDSSAIFSFTKIKRLAQARGIELVLTHISPKIQKQFWEVLPASVIHYFTDLDHGIEWCEDRMIANFKDTGLRLRSGSLYQQLVRTLPSEDQVTILKQYLKPRQVGAGERIIAQGQSQSGLYMIESGQVAIQIECEDGSLLRLRTLGAGAFFGEMGLYSGDPASADVLADQPTSLHVLMADDLAEMERSAPIVAAALHRFVAAYMSERLAKMTATLQAHK